MQATSSVGIQSISHLRRKNVWWTVRDGNWSDPSIWMSNGSKRKGFITSLNKPTNPSQGLKLITGEYAGRDEYIQAIAYNNSDLDVALSCNHFENTPMPGDIVCIHHSVTYSVLFTGLPQLMLLDELEISESGVLTITGGGTSGVYIRKALRCRGTLNHNTNSFISIEGACEIANYISVSGAGIRYCGRNDQTILSNITYRNLAIHGVGIKQANGDITVLENLTVAGFETPNSTSRRSYFELGTYNLTVNGTTTIAGGTLQKSGGGNVLFVGQLIMTSAINGLDFSGNPTVELRGGGAFQALFAAYGNPWETGTGVWRFTTSNQTWNVSQQYLPCNCHFEIASGITVTATGNGRWQINNDIEGVSGTSVLDNRGYIGYAGVEAMQTGVLRCDLAANTFEYNGTNQNVKDITYWNLNIAIRNENVLGSIGTKTAINHLTCLGFLFINGSASGKNTLQLGNWNLTVTGITDIRPYGRLVKSGSGNVLFTGALTFQGAPANQSELDFSAGNPTVECRNGIVVWGGVQPLIFKTGTGTWSFTTNNQNFQGGFVNFTFDCPIVIGSDITLSVVNVGADIWMRINNTINGSNANSRLLIGNNNATNRSRIYFLNSNAQMTTGIFDFTTNQDAVVGYLFNEAYVLPFTTYRHLVIAGTGTKTVSGNLTILENLNIGENGFQRAYLDLESYDLTVEKQVIIGAQFSGLGTQCRLSKTGAGNVLFKGPVTYSFSGEAGMPTGIDFSGGNPTVECRGGLLFSSVGNAPIFTGTGTWSFTTNNQSIQSGETVYTFDCPINIADGITLTHSVSSGTFSVLILNGVLNGLGANSIFDSRTRLTYNNPTAPMITGKLYANQNTTNTFRYSRAGNQDIKVPDDPTNPGYRNLVLEGSGAKRLLGNVSVKGTYTLIAPATLDSNGFSLTNP